VLLYDTFPFAGGWLRADSPFILSLRLIEGPKEAQLPDVGLVSKGSGNIAFPSVYIHMISKLNP